MKNPRITHRYAKSLIDLAAEMNCLGEVVEDMKMVSGIMGESRDMRIFLKSPIIKEYKKTSVIHSLFENRVSKLTLAFFDILIKKRREEFLPQIAEEFHAQYNEKKHIMTAEVKTAIPLDDELRQKITGLIRAAAGTSQIELTEKTDPKIIGGFLLKIGDKLYDGTIIFKLNQLKRQFRENPYIGEYLLN
ncbi:MAG: ATP synthase F1 subunit delta [Bacteroidetes bacterium]|nr:ATP synthase F1 subunit delta [Bacteroidota bacterium]